MAKFTWVNLDSLSVTTKDEENDSIIKSHAMRFVRSRQRRKEQINGSNTVSQVSHEVIRQRAAQVGYLRKVCTPTAYRPTTDWEQTAICQFLASFVYLDQRTPVVAFQYFNFLPDLYGSSSTSSCMTEAIAAVALARLGNVNRAVEIDARAKKAYANALGMVNKSIMDPKERKTDQILTTLCLLAKYELVTGQANDQLFQAHETGQAALIAERDQGEWLKTNVGINLFRLVYMRHLMTCIATSKAPAIELGPGSLELAYAGAPCMQALLGLIRRTADLRHETENHLYHECNSAADTYRLVKCALGVDAEMVALAEVVPLEMRYHTMVNRRDSADVRPTDVWTPPAINIFRSLQHASFWHVYFYTHLHVLQSLLQLCTSHRSAFCPRKDLQARLLKVIDEICASIPDTLNERGSSGTTNGAFTTEKDGSAVAGHYLTWSLVVAKATPGVPPAQQQWMKGRLEWIGYSHGIGEALRRA